MVHSHYHLLFIEDEPVDQMAFENFIKRQHLNYEYKVASSVAEAKTFLSAHRFDLILVDYQLGDGEAFDLFPFFDGVPFVFLSGQGSEEVAVRALRAGASDYLIKDHDYNYLTLLPFAIFTSVTRSQKNERLQLLESVVVNANDGICVLKYHKDTPTQIQAIYINQALQEMTGYSTTDIQFRSQQILFHYQNEAQTLKVIETSLLNHAELRVELVNERKDGTFYWVDVNLVPIADPDPEYLQMVAIQRDITERKQVEQDLINARIEADRAREREKSVMATLSHEVRNPIQTLSNLVHLLEKTDLSDAQQQYVESLHFTTEFMVELLSNILEKAKLESGNIQVENIPFVPENLWKKIEAMHSFRAKEKGIELVFEMDPKIPKVLVGDPVRLQQILSNLLSNAIKFTEKGLVKASIFLDKKGASHCRLGFFITDSGIGISAPQQARIFDPYQQAEAGINRQYGGTGLGLAIVKQLVSVLNGEIQVQSKLGQGAEFQVWLDYDIETNQATEATIAPSLDKQQLNLLKGKKMLIVEDNPSNLLLTAKILEPYEMDLTLTENGNKAWQALQEQAFDVMLTDIQLPDQNGGELASNLRAKADCPNQQIPILAFTGLEAGEKHKALLRKGVDRLLTKPFQPHELIQLLCWSLSDQRVLGEATQENAGESFEFDLQPLRRLSPSNPKFVNEMVDIFLMLTPKALDKMETAYHEEDWEKMFKTAHFIKSTFRSVGNEELFQLIEGVESEAHNEFPEVQKISQALSRMRTICSHLIPKLYPFATPGKFTEKDQPVSNSQKENVFK